MQSVEGGISSQEQLFEFVGKLAEIRAGAEPAPPDNSPEHTRDPALRPLINRILQNLNLRLELGGGTPISEEQESELRDALFDTLSQWKDRDGTP